MTQSAKPLAVLCVSLVFIAGDLLNASSLTATAPPEIVQAPRSDDGWAIVSEGDATRITDREGHRQDLPLAPGESLFLLSDMGGDSGGRWIAGGTTVDEKGMDLLLTSGSRQTFQRLSVPARGATQPLRLRAVPLVSGERLVGLAWLEGSGHRSLAVRASAWDGESWSAPQTVSPPGAGSQAGLVGTVLTDGSWLLAWTSFDGEDDEVLWSFRRENGWTAPARVHPGNEVQDVRPSLVTVREGALLAWSRFDGTTYRTELARFHRERWQPIELQRSLPAVEPTWVASDRWVALLLKTADPLGWTIRQLALDGTPLRRWVASDAVGSRPLIDPTGEQPNAWEWLVGGQRKPVALTEDRNQ